MNTTISPGRAAGRGSRHLVAIAAAWLLCLLAGALLDCDACNAAQPRGPAELAIVGPTSARIGEVVRLRLEGMPAVDLAKTMGEQLAWIAEIAIVVDAPAGAATKFSIDQNLGIKLSPFTWSFTIDFSASIAADFVVIVDWNRAPYGLAHHRVQVGGGGPGPQPPPVPPEPPKPDPTPPGLARVIVVEESAERTVAQGRLLSNQRLLDWLAARKLKLEMIDQHAVNQAGSAPARVNGYLSLVKGKPLPQLVLDNDLDDDNAGASCVPLPADVDGLLKVLQERGGE